MKSCTHYTYVAVRIVAVLEQTESPDFPESELIGPKYSDFYQDPQIMAITEHINHKLKRTINIANSLSEGISCGLHMRDTTSYHQTIANTMTFG